MIRSKNPLYVISTTNKYKDFPYGSEGAVDKEVYNNSTSKVITVVVNHHHSVTIPKTDIHTSCNSLNNNDQPNNATSLKRLFHMGDEVILTRTVAGFKKDDVVVVNVDQISQNNLVHLLDGEHNHRAFVSTEDFKLSTLDQKKPTKQQKPYTHIVVNTGGTTYTSLQTSLKDAKTRAKELHPSDFKNIIIFELKPILTISQTTTFKKVK